MAHAAGPRLPRRWGRHCPHLSSAPTRRRPPHPQLHRQDGVQDHRGHDAARRELMRPPQAATGPRPPYLSHPALRTLVPMPPLARPPPPPVFPLSSTQFFNAPASRRCWAISSSPPPAMPCPGARPFLPPSCPLLPVCGGRRPQDAARKHSAPPVPPYTHASALPHPF